MITATEEAQIKGLVRYLWEAHNRKPSDTAITRWTEKIAKFGDMKAIMRVLDAACDAGSMPALPEILTKLWVATRRTEDDQVVHTLTAEERERSELACVKSMLWLHYNKPNAIGFMTTLAARQLGCAPDEALAKAIERYPRWVIDDWMADQRLAGN